MGDFNYPNIDWADGTAQSTKARYILNVIPDNFISQIIEAYASMI